MSLKIWTISSCEEKKEWLLDLAERSQVTQKYSHTCEIINLNVPWFRV